MYQFITSEELFTVVLESVRRHLSIQERFDLYTAVYEYTRNSVSSRLTMDQIRHHRNQCANPRIYDYVMRYAVRYADGI